MILLIAHLMMLSWFQNNKLVKVHFIYTTDDGNLQQQMSKKFLII